MDVEKLKTAIDEVKAWAAPLHGGKDTHVMGALDRVIAAAEQHHKLHAHGYGSDVDQALREPRPAAVVSADGIYPAAPPVGTAGQAPDPLGAGQDAALHGPGSNVNDPSDAAADTAVPAVPPSSPVG